MWHVAFESVWISISVSLLVRAQGGPAEWPLWTRRTGVSLYLPRSEMYVPRAGEVGLSQSYSPRLVELLNSKLAHAFTRPQRSKQPATLAGHKVNIAVNSFLRLVGTCPALRVMSSSPPIPAMSPSPAGLARMEGIPTVAQPVLHREILHAHAARLFGPHLSPPFLERVTCPHLQVQLRGLDSAI